MSSVGYLTLLLVVCSFASGDCRGSGYSRTVSYKDDVLIKCSNLDSTVVNWLLTEGIDVWHAGIGGSMTFRMSSTKFKRLQRRLPDCVESGNVEDVVRKAEDNILATGLTKSLEWFDEYHNYEDIMDWWKALSEKSDLVTMYDIGKSFEGRDMSAVNITADPTAELPYVYFQCLIHSREWISGSSCMYVANELVEAYNNNDERVFIILNQARLVFIPVVNPDGYVYTWTADRLWRKNRHPSDRSPCIGVDLNRNYDTHWGEGGSSDNPCSETFHGESAASEIEVKNIQDFFLSLPEVLGAMDWHSYSQLILRPWGWTTADTPDEDRLKKLSEEMANEIKNVHNMTYDPIKIIQLTRATGGSIDWFYDEPANINNKYRAAGLAFELRDTGQFGFILPPTEIIPTGQEIYPSVLHFIEDLLENPLEKPNGLKN